MLIFRKYKIIDNYQQFSEKSRERCESERNQIQKRKTHKHVLIFAYYVIYAKM